MSTMRAETTHENRPKVFLSYARQDRRIAERLRASLERLGCTVTDPTRLEADESLGSRMEETVRDADRVVLLLGKHRRRDRLQESEWQAALEAKWEDADKRLIPVVLGDAEVPSFVRSTAVPEDFGLHLSGLKDIERAAEVIVQGARRVRRGGESARSGRGEDLGEFGRTEMRRIGSAGAGKSDKAARRPCESEIEFSIEPVEPEERRKRFAAIERFARELAEEREAS
jgi:hypothetical protein